MISFMLYLSVLTATGEVHHTPVRSYGSLLECQQKGAYAAREIVKVPSIYAAQYQCVESTNV